MKRAMAKQAEAEREKRAKIINAEGESLAAAALGEASDVMMAHPLALQLRRAGRARVGLGSRCRTYRASGSTYWPDLTVVLRRHRGSPSPP
jgi:hypothetical protein